MDVVIVEFFKGMSPEQKIIIGGFLLVLYLLSKLGAKQDKKMKIRNFVRARIDMIILKFDVNIDKLDAPESEKDIAKLRFEVLARTYLSDSIMSSILKNGFSKYSEQGLEGYCADTGEHILGELLKRFGFFKTKYPTIAKYDKELLYSTSGFTGQYARCAKFYISLNPSIFKKIREVFR